MSISILRRLGFLFTLLCITAAVTHPGSVQAKAAPASTPASTPAPAPAPSDDSAAAASAAASDGDFNDEPTDRRDHSESHHRRHHGSAHEDGNIISLFHSSHLESGQKAESVVSVLGSSTSDGEAGDVVSVIGNTRVTGPVSDSAVAVLGSVYVDNKVAGDVVAVLGNVELGPNAEVGGDVVAVMGRLQRDPAAIVHGSVQRIIDVDFGGITGFSWLNTWVTHCLFLGRPLALTPGLGWAWTLALSLLAFYACLALMFRSAVDQCVHTLESAPGHTALAALLGILLTPVLLLLLCITLIGIAAVPFVVGALFCMSLFGKAVMLAWLGGRISGRRPGPAGHPAVAVLIGGAVVLVLYVVPILGFLVYKLLGFFGFGAVVYTLLLRLRARRAGNGQPPSAAGTGGAETFTSAPSAPPSSPTMAGPGWTAGGAASAAAAAANPAIAAEAVPPASAASSGSAAPPHTSHPAASAAAAAITAALPRAGFWVRMGALFLDVVLVGFAMSLLRPFGDFHIVVLAIYGAVMWKLRGTTVGGIVFDLHVVRVDGRPVDWETAIVRALGCFLSLCVVFLGFIWIAFDYNHQAWHDKIAGTVVVRAKRGAVLA